MERADQPLYASAKEMPWLWPDSYGETKFVILMGSLHIEMALHFIAEHIVRVTSPGGEILVTIYDTLFFC